MALHSGDSQRNGPPPHKKSRKSDPMAGAVGGDQRIVDREAIRQQRESLPVFRLQKRLMQELERSPTSVLIGETGSGKSTQIPQFCLSAGLISTGIVAVTQPRRVAAISLAGRVADECGCRVGERVGFSVRFEDCSSNQTRIKYLTDGMLLRETMHDRLLRRYSCVILDEAHERTVHTDVLFGVLKKIQKLRRFQHLPELRLIIMSATMDVDHFSGYFNNAPVIYLQGRQYPVQVHYTREMQEDPVFSSLVTTVQIHQTAPPDQDVLVFLTGQEEIESMVANLRMVAKALPSSSAVVGADQNGGVGSCAPRLRVVPLYASLPLHLQMEVFRPTPPGQRKVVVATNIAETSITLPNIKYVVDCGLVKARYYQASTGMEMLRVQKVSQAQAWQRTGRAGRQSAGYCYRVYTRGEYDSLVRDSIPEIQRCNLSNVCLQLLSIGVKNVSSFDFIDRPADGSIEGALCELELLGAVTSSSTAGESHMTALGRQMAAFPLDPKFARAILASKEFNCTEEVVTIVSILSAETILLTPPSRRQEALAARQKFVAPEGDMITLLNVYRAYSKVHRNKEWCAENYLHARHLSQADSIRRQLLELCRRVPGLQAGSSTLHTTDGAAQILRSLCAGMFSSAAQLTKQGHHVTVGSGEKVELHPSSVLFMTRPSCVIYTELLQTSKKYLRGVSAVDPHWLQEAAPQYFSKHRLLLT